MCLTSWAPRRCIKFCGHAGVDLPSRREFVAHNLTDQGVCEVLGADGLIYQSVEELLACGHELNPDIECFDASCFNGQYVAGDITEDFLRALEQGGRGQARTVQLAGQATVVSP
jgi:amidophosphoribosyltransferase